MREYSRMGGVGLIVGPEPKLMLSIWKKRAATEQIALEPFGRTDTADEVGRQHQLRQLGHLDLAVPIS